MTDYKHFSVSFIIFISILRIFFRQFQNFRIFLAKNSLIKNYQTDNCKEMSKMDYDIHCRKVKIEQKKSLQAEEYTDYEYHDKLTDGVPSLVQKILSGSIIKFVIFFAAFGIILNFVKCIFLT